MVTMGALAQSETTANSARQSRDVFAGMSLTQDQKDKLAALQAKHKALRKERGRTRCAHDTTLTREQRMAMRAGRDSTMRAVRLSFLREVKDIVGPEQYVVFLENMVVNQGGRRPDMRGARQGKGHKTHKTKNIKAKRDGKRSEFKATAQKRRADKTAEIQVTD